MPCFILTMSTFVIPPWYPGVEQIVEQMLGVERAPVYVMALVKRNIEAGNLPRLVRYFNKKTPRSARLPADASVETLFARVMLKNNSVKEKFVKKCIRFQPWLGSMIMGYINQRMPPNAFEIGHLMLCCLPALETFYSLDNPLEYMLKNIFAMFSDRADVDLLLAYNLVCWNMVRVPKLYALRRNNVLHSVMECVILYMRKNFRSTHYAFVGRLINTKMGLQLRYFRDRRPTLNRVMYASHHPDSNSERGVQSICHVRRCPCSSVPLRLKLTLWCYYRVGVENEEGFTF